MKVEVEVEIEAQPTRLILSSWILSFRVSTPYIFFVILNIVTCDTTVNTVTYLGDKVR